MKIVLALTAAVMLLMSLTSCRSIEDLDNNFTQPTSPTVSLPAVTDEEPISDEKLTDNVPSFTVSEASVTTETTDGDVTPNSVSETNTDISDTPQTALREGFSFPEEFNVRLSEILARYSVNVNCDPESEPCGCQPETETTAVDGSIVRDRVMSLYYCDIESGYEIYINPGVHYPIASTVKIPFCVLIYEKIAAGEIDPERILTYEKRHYFGGTGVIVEGDFGQQFTVLELLKLAITRSDNVAYEMLKDLVSWEEFDAYLLENGASHEEDRRRSKQKICSESAKAYGMILRNFLVSDNPYVETFKADLLSTRNKMIVSHYPVYRKYGWTNFAFHDIAYVDAPHPYIFAVLCNMDDAENGEYALIAELSYLFEEYALSDR